MKMINGELVVAIERKIPSEAVEMIKLYDQKHQNPSNTIKVISEMLDCRINVASDIYNYLRNTNYI